MKPKASAPGAESSKLLSRPPGARSKALSKGRSKPLPAAACPQRKNQAKNQAQSQAEGYNEGQAFEAFLRQCFHSAFKKTPSSCGAALRKAIARALLSPQASRFRPQVCLSAAACLGVLARDVFPLAGAVEMIHSASLIQDDLPCMDNSKTRRGQPSCHILFGEDIALLAASSLYIEAFALLSRARSQDSSAALRLLVRLFAEKAGFQGMMLGQALDLRGGELSERRAAVRDRLKTGRLFEAAAEAPALLYGRSEDQERLSRYGRAMGLAYQAADDLLDQEKAAGELARLCGQRLRRQTAKALKAIEAFSAKAERLRGLAWQLRQRALAAE